MRLFACPAGANRREGFRFPSLLLETSHPKTTAARVIWLVRGAFGGVFLLLRGMRYDGFNLLVTCR